MSCHHTPKKMKLQTTLHSIDLELPIVIDVIDTPPITWGRGTNKAEGESKNKINASILGVKFSHYFPLLPLFFLYSSLHHIFNCVPGGVCGVWFLLCVQIFMVVRFHPLPIPIFYSPRGEYYFHPNFVYPYRGYSGHS